MARTMTRPILTLTTDFGAADHYAGAMKGVILRICPEAHIVDITHDVTPFAIAEGAYSIAQAWRYFPERTVHVAVVDPGVGTARRPILVEAGGQYFVGPDNGLLSMVYLHEPARVRLIANEKYFLHPVSQTFHGRDIFAPVAAHLAAGVAPASIGDYITNYSQPDFAQPRRDEAGAWIGQIIKADRFGNLITNFHTSEFAGLGQAPFTLTLGTRRITALARNYQASAPGELFLIVGSSGYYEISLREGNAAEYAQCQPGTGIELQIP
jgi:S-adenosylmethionine hydrolase